MNAENPFWQELAALFATKTGSPLFRLLLVLYFLCFLDVVTTILIIRYGGTELNPFMTMFAVSPLMHLLLKWLVVFIIFLLASASEQKIRNSGVIIMGIACLWYVVVVLHNSSALNLHFLP
ncbi:MAG: DUF5658 family protein [Methanoregula sp.]|nr:DUF5658 family protein [Methanoregula sp.]